jgi:hypothetical protein
MSHRLASLLNTNSTTDGAYTLITGGDRRWRFSGAVVGRVFQEYCRLVVEGEGNLNLAEPSVSEIPLIVAMSFEFSQPEVITDGFVHTLVALMQQIILDTLNTDDNVYCVVMTGEEEAINNETYRCAYRFQFPVLCVERTYITKTFLPRLLRLLRERNAVAMLSCQPNNDWPRIIVANYTDNPIPLYGSVDFNGQVLQVTEVLGLIDIEELDDVPSYSLAAVIRPTNHLYFRQDFIKSIELEHHKDPVFWLPLFCSINYYLTPTYMAATPSTPAVISITNPHLQTAADLLTMVREDRGSSLSSWLDIGKVLYALDEGQDDGFRMWVAFTERQGAYTSSQCRRHWAVFRIDDINLGLGTLEWFARIDSPDSYRVWKDARIEAAITTATTLTHTDVAKALFEAYGLEYVCASQSKTIWYHYHRHGWNRMDGNVYFSRVVANGFIPLVARMISGIAAKVYREDTALDQREAMNTTISRLSTLNTKLSNHGYKNAVIKEAATFFYVENFAAMLDADNRLTRCLNGVIEVNDRVVEFRPGKPQDYVSKSTLINYDANMTKRCPEYCRLKLWIKQLFPDRPLRRTFKKDLAAALKGRNAEKRLRCVSGVGDNTKTAFFKLRGLALGTYFVKISCTVLTENRKRSGEANPETEQLRGAREVVTDEPDAEKERFRSGVVKMMTGNDDQFNRGLYQEGSVIKPQYRVWVLCNMVPALGSGRAERQRLWIYPMKSVWARDAPADIKEQWEKRIFPLIDDFEDGLPELAIAMLRMMVRWYPKYVTERLPVVPEVAAALNDYWEMNDPYTAFIRTKVEAADPSMSISVQDMYREFHQWHVGSYPNEKMPPLPIATKMLSSRLGEPVNCFWCGYRFRMEGNIFTGLVA